MASLREHERRLTEAERYRLWERLDKEPEVVEARRAVGVAQGRCGDAELALDDAWADHAAAREAAFLRLLRAEGNEQEGG